MPAQFGLRRPLDVTRAIHVGRLDGSRVAELAPVAVRAAGEGDAVALGLIEALADECASFVNASIRRLSIARLAVPVVLAGGVARGAGALLADPVADRVRAVAPLATVAVLEGPPVLGAALLALDRAAAVDEVAEGVAGDAVAANDEPARRLRAELTHERLAAGRTATPSG